MEDKKPVRKAEAKKVKIIRKGVIIEVSKKDLDAYLKVGFDIVIL